MQTDEESPVSPQQQLTEEQLVGAKILEVENYPNPFNPVTVIRYELPQNSQVRLEVFDMLGRRVAVLVDGLIEAGTHEIPFDASNLASGVYLYRLTAGQVVQTRQMVLVK